MDLVGATRVSRRLGAILVYQGTKREFSGSEKQTNSDRMKLRGQRSKGCVT